MPAGAERDFIPAYELGSDVYAIDQELIRIDIEIDDLRDDIKDEKTTPESREGLSSGWTTSRTIAIGAAMSAAYCWIVRGSGVWGRLVASCVRGLGFGIGDWVGHLSCTARLRAARGVGCNLGVCSRSTAPACLKKNRRRDQMDPGSTEGAAHRCVVEWPG